MNLVNDMAMVNTWSSLRKKDFDAAINRSLIVLVYSNCKKEQTEAAVYILSCKNVFVSVVTGFDKSFIFQILPICAMFLLEQLINNILLTQQ